MDELAPITWLIAQINHRVRRIREARGMDQP